MKSKILSCLLAFVSVTMFAQTQIKTTGLLPRKDRLHMYLLMGQSNMAGRGKFEEQDKTLHVRVFAFTTNNTWEPAIEPVTHDRAPDRLGVGPGLAFGKAMVAKDAKIYIGLIPCAVGGTPLSRWSKGGDLYERAVARARLAMRDGTLKGIIWHQGENDSSKEETAKTYEERLTKMINDIRAELLSPDLPFVAGQIGEFLYHRKDPSKSPYAKTINDALENIAARVPNVACVKSTGLKDTGDEVHFDSASQREFGKRYAEAISRLQKAKK